MQVLDRENKEVVLFVDTSCTILPSCLDSDSLNINLSTQIIVQIGLVSTMYHVICSNI